MQSQSYNLQVTHTRTHTHTIISETVKTCIKTFQVESEREISMCIEVYKS